MKKQKSRNKLLKIMNNNNKKIKMKAMSKNNK